MSNNIINLQAAKEKLEQFFEELDQEQKPKWQKIFFLERANGDFFPRYHFTVDTGGGFHQKGLEPQEERDLLWYSAYIFGMAEGLGLTGQALQEVFSKYRDKYNEYYIACCET